jgi:pimeloyl-ACP methyl ester carboxylesterase
MRCYISGLLGAGAFTAAVLGASPAPVVATQSGFVPVPCAAREWAAAEAPVEPRNGARAFSGRYDGGIYKVEIPDKWNGELVIWAHGFVAATGEQGLRLRAPDHPLRAHLIDQGFAWVSSSYQCNGYVPGQAFLNSAALVDVFSRVNDGRAPARTYFTGASMGGFATLLAMHESPDRFAGGLSMCPAAPELTEFFSDAARSAASLAGITAKADTLQADLKSIIAALGTAPAWNETGRTAANRQIALSGGPRPFAAEGALERDQFVSNIRTGARGLVPPLSAPASQFREERPFSGRISKPVLTMHTTGDLFVPIFLEQHLKRAVVAAGRGQFLVQRIYRAAGHCTFSPQESIAAFDDLIAWVRNGKVPDGDDVMGDLSDAGRKFTNPLRPGDPGGLIVK